MSITAVNLPEAPSPPADRRRWRRLPRSGKLWVGLGLVAFFILLGFVGSLFTADPNAIGDEGLTAPSARHWLGTSQTGQDVLAMLLAGARGSITIGVIIGVLATVLSVLVGVTGGYLGGRVDESFSLFTNVVLVIPGLPLVIIVTDYIENRGLLTVALTITITSWAASARVLRAQTLSLRERDYVRAARAGGERTWRIILVEILPNLLPVIASQFIFAIIFGLLSEAALSFLGLGGSDHLTWGTMLYFSWNAQALALGAWWWFVPPGLSIALLGAGLSLINFSLDEIINPRLRTRGAE
jgi:peptide/nickel transport system permease protein